MIAEVERAQLESIAALDLRYAIFGGLAVSVWTTPRATREVDLYADLKDCVRGLAKLALGLSPTFDPPLSVPAQASNPS